MDISTPTLGASAQSMPTIEGLITYVHFRTIVPVDEILQIWDLEYLQIWGSEFLQIQSPEFLQGHDTPPFVQFSNTFTKDEIRL